MSPLIRTSSAAAVFRPELGEFRIEKVEFDGPAAGEVQLKIIACGACHSDVHKIKAATSSDQPLIVGHEVSGIVEKVGVGVDHVAPGDRVVCSFIASCGECENCTSADGQLCGRFRQNMQQRGVSMDGRPRYYSGEAPIQAVGIGALSETAVVPGSAVFRLPDGAPLSESAVLGCAVLTAYGAVHRFAQLKNEESCVVIGLGGVGLGVAMLSALQAKTVIGVDIRDDTLELAMNLGAAEAINSRNHEVGERIMELTSGRGVDVVFDCVGSPETIRTGFSLLATGGRLVVSGLAGAGQDAQIPLGELVRGRKQIIGSYAADPAKDMPALLELVAQGLVDPRKLIAARYPLASAQKAYDSVRQGRVAGRALIDLVEA